MSEVLKGQGDLDISTATPVGHVKCGPSLNPKLEPANNSKNDINGQSEEETSGLEQSRELTPPPLPPRHQNLEALSKPSTTPATLPLPPGPSQTSRLRSSATTALSLADVHTSAHSEGHHTPFSSSSRSASVSRQRSRSKAGQRASRSGSDVEDSASIRSYVPTLETAEDVESLLGDLLNNSESKTPRYFDTDVEEDNFFHIFAENEGEIESAFQREFDELEDLATDASNEDSLMHRWRSKLKHYFILSSSGKPIYSRHGDDQLISNSIGILQTIISSYQRANGELKCFTTDHARFVIVSKGHLHLAAISRLGESEMQLRAQLEALYMQILSTLTLPKMKQMFINRPSTDLRRPLQGTETLLSALADGFTRGSPSTLLAALECLNMRKSHRQTINNTFLKVRCRSLLYGLIVAGGRLVSVLRPKKHSLHPGDLQLIFNMLFEADSIRAGGGENWIPLCLPGFNDTGYLYMYVSFLDAEREEETGARHVKSASSRDSGIALVLISNDKESFFELRQMRDDLVNQLEANGAIRFIRSSLEKGRPSCPELFPGTVIRHFIFKSRNNVQFTMPSSIPTFESPFAWRRLISVYHTLNAIVHSRMPHPRVHHCSSLGFILLAWNTPVFEFYCVASPNASRNAVVQSANRVVQWARKEEERLFILGGAVF